MTTNSLPASKFSQWWKQPANQIPTLLFMAARILISVIGIVAISTGVIHNIWAQHEIFVQSLEARSPQRILDPLVEPWHRWDTGWYLKIAVKGYSAEDGSIIFGPLYPAVIAVVGRLVGDVLLGALIVSSLSTLLLLLLLYRLVKLDTNSDSVATHTLLLLVAFPTAFYLLIGYTESLFLACVVGAFWAGRTSRWWLAAVLAAIAALTRAQGWVLFFPLGWMAFVQAPRWWQSPGITWRQRLLGAIPRLAAMGSGPLMVLLLYIYLAVAGLGTVADAYTRFWGMDVRPPWDAIIDVVSKIVNGRAGLIEYAGFVALLLIVGLMLASLRVLDVPYQLYLWTTLLLVLLRYYPSKQLNGTMRYVLDFFPIFITAAILLQHHPRWRFLWIVIGGVLQALMTYLFATWQWIA